MSGPLLGGSRQGSPATWGTGPEGAVESARAMFAAGEEARAAAVRATVRARALKFLPPVLELCTDAVDPGLIHPVHQELPIAESTDTGQHLSQNGPVEACVPLSSEFDQPLPRVPGPDEGVDVDEVTDLGPGEQSFHPAGRHIVSMQHRPPLAAAGGTPQPNRPCSPARSPDPRP